MLRGAEKRHEKLLRNAALHAHINLFRTALGYTAQNHPEIIHYLLLTGPTRFYAAFHLIQGHWLTPQATQSTAAFLASQSQDSVHQQGLLQTFSPTPLIEIRPLQASYQNLAFAGQYWVESATMRQYQQFVQQFVSQVNRQNRAALSPPYTVQAFEQNLNTTSGIHRPAGFGTWGVGLTSDLRVIQGPSPG